MSIMASLSRSRPPHLKASVIGGASAQARGYATKDTQRQQSQGFKMKVQGPEKKWKVFKKDHSGAFRPMPVAQLQAPVFEPNARTELQLPVFQPQSLTDWHAAGKAMSFPVSDNNAIRIYGVPKNVLVDFRLLSKPCSVVRDTTLQVLGKLDAASQTSSMETRAVLTGPSGCGKSYLLLQAVEYCTANKWLVIYIPRSINLVNSTTNYYYDPRTRTYVQPTFSYQILQRFLTVNSAALQTLQTTKEILLERGSTLPVGTPLTELIAVGMKDKAHAPFVLSALMAEIGRQTSYPVLLAVDDFQAMYCQSLYRNQRFEGIKPYHLSIPRLILEYASGKKQFARGAVLGALSSTNTTFQLPLELREALSLPYDRPTGPYDRRSPELVDYAKGLQNFPVPAQLQIDEAASMFEVWMQDKALHCVAKDETFMTKYSEAAGNARDFVWKGLLSTLST